MHIGIVVDHPKRDLPGAVLLAHHLTKRIASVSIIPMYEQGVDVPRLGLDAIVMNYVREANYTLIENYAGAGIDVYVLDTEGGVLAQSGGNSPKNFAERIAGSGISDKLSGYFFWGSLLRDEFLKRGVLPPDKMHLTGCPRFDFAAPRWRKLLKYKRSGFVLVNANFPLVNPKFSSGPDGERSAMIAAGWNSDYVDRLLADLKVVFAGYLETVAQMAAQRPNVDILVRPHPFEDEGIYHDALDEFKNVSIDGQGNVLDVIQNSAAIVHLNCGTAIEGIMLGKIPLNLSYLDTEATKNHAPLPASISRPVSSFEELLHCLDHIQEETRTFQFEKLYAEHIHQFFHNADGAASERVADALVQSGRLNKHRNIRHDVKNVLASSRPAPSIGQRFKGLSNFVFGSAFTSHALTLVRTQKRDKVLDLDLVRSLSSELTRHDPGSPPLDVVQAKCRYLKLPLASISIRVSSRHAAAAPPRNVA